MENKKIRIAINLMVLVLFILLLTYLTVRYAPQIKQLIQKPEEFEKFLRSYGNISILIFILFQVVQVVVAAIPGELVQVAGGYVYGILFGTVYSAAGIFLGSMAAFFFARIFGYRLVKNLMPKGSLEKFEFLLNGKRADVALFILFLIPGLPKDVLTYISGFTPIDPYRFFLITLVARLPGIFASALIGASMRERQYTGVIIMCVIALMLSILGLAVKERIIGHLKKQ